MYKCTVVVLFVVCLSVQLAAKNVKSGNISLELSGTYQQNQIIEKSSLRMIIIMGKLRKDGTQPSIFINQIDVSKFPVLRQRRIPQDPMKNIDGFLGTMKSRYKDFKHSKVESVKIDDHEFARITWSGKIIHKRLSFDMKGVIMVNRTGNMVYQLNFMDSCKHADSEMKNAENILKTLKFTKKSSTGLVGKAN